jgi:NAD+ kinase
MDRFYIVTNKGKDPDLSVTHAIMTHLSGRGKTCAYSLGNDRCDSNGSYYTNPEMIPEQTDCILVLGGDGTLIHTATDTIDRQIPLLGVNLGTLGYLAEIDRSRIYTAMDHLIRDEYTIERRMVLSGTVVRDGEVVQSSIAMNDIVLRKDDAYGTIVVKNYVNDSYLNSYRADGIIISSPTGSTGYSLSVGGPIISPEADLFLMTPLAAHVLNTRSIVLPCEDRISVIIGEGRDQEPERAAAFFDGRMKVPMTTGDRIAISRSKKDVLFAKIDNHSFLDTLSRKMNN